MSTSRTPRDERIDVNGLRLRYLDWGNDAAPPMLLLHGFSGHAHTWDTFARAIADRFHVLALDQRGHGDSDWAKDGAYAPADHARDVAALHDRLGLGPVVLVGLSMGGRNAIAHTARHPATVEKLVIVDIGPDIAPQGAERVRRMAAEAPEEFTSPEEAIAYLRRYATLPSAAAESALRHRVEHGLRKLPDGRYGWKYDRFLRDQRRQGRTPPADLWPAVRQIKAPTLILRGAESDVFAPETAKRMHELIPGSRLVEIPGAGHSIPADAPEAFERAVREFLGA
jgi:pimeloyl-ACP methyl ester carboxylesterase